MAELKIYRASAGSGKTHRITGECLKLLIRYPNKYRNILAVTFTNKATAEMKGRIVEEVYALAIGNSSPFISEITSEIIISEQEARARAKIILENILHDYSRFTVETIDSFFQRVLRSFIRELGLPAGFDIELDSDRVLEQAVDMLWTEIDANNDLREWIISFMKENIEEGRSWNITQELLKLGKEVFKEDFRENSESYFAKLGDRAFLQSYLKDLHEIRSTFEGEMKEYSEKAFKIMTGFGLVINDFKYGGSSFANYFYKIGKKKEYEPGKRAMDAIDKPDGWCTNTSSKKNAIAEAYHSGLNECLKSAIQCYQKHYIAYASAGSVLKNYRVLGIVSDIAAEIAKYCRDNNLFLLPDATLLLNRLIGENDAPFIYEKLGSIYEYLMIDEFQDTSGLQYSNFKPLILNSLSQGKECMIVGDVKQSIYRWRGGNWKLLAEEVLSDFSGFKPLVVTLDKNWRSRKEIVNFVNIFFESASQILEDIMSANLSGITDNRINDLKGKILSAYDALRQLSRDDKPGGLVSIKFIDSDSETTWEDRMLIELPEKVQYLIDQGCKAEDIAVLVRTNNEGAKVINALSSFADENVDSGKRPFEVVSGDSFLLKNSSSVCFIISVLKYLIDPQDQVNNVDMYYKYRQYIKIDPNDPVNILEQIPFDDCINLINPRFRLVEKELRCMPLYEMTEKIIQLFGINEDMTGRPFVLALLDEVWRYTRKNAANIIEFIEWWEDNKYKISLPSTENPDAVRVLTIHKSKGLQFKVVLVPYANWTLEPSVGNQGTILWCKPSVEPFDRLERLPVKYQKDLQNTIFAYDYYSESMQAYVDNLNLLYVAFTRAEDALICFSPTPEPKGGFKKVENLLFHLLSPVQPTGETNTAIIQDFTQCWDVDEKEFSIGELTIENKVSEKASTTETLVFDELSASSSGQNSLRLKLQGLSYFSLEERPRLEKIDTGNLMHEIFSRIEHLDDLEIALQQSVTEGKLSVAEVPSMFTKVNNLLSKPEVRVWFETDWKVRTEADILLSQGHTARPDRVLTNGTHAIVIDYKFGETEKHEHITQVQQYKEWLKEMGYRTVEGFVWYIKIDKIERA
jgi:ATP-dependent helicase/nuclease subunit A